MYDHTFYKQVQISRSDTRPHITWAVSLVILHMITSIFLRALCGYIWVNILTLLRRGAKNNKADQKMELWGVHRITPSPWWNKWLRKWAPCKHRWLQAPCKNRWLPTTNRSSPFQRRIELRLAKLDKIKALKILCATQTPGLPERYKKPSKLGVNIKSLANQAWIKPSKLGVKTPDSDVENAQNSVLAFLRKSYP